MVMLCCQAASAQSRQEKAVSHLDVLKANVALTDNATTLSTSGCKDATIMSSLRALQVIISIGTHKGILLEFGQAIVYVDCEMEGERTEPWGSPSLKVIEGPT